MIYERCSAPRATGAPLPSTRSSSCPTICIASGPYRRAIPTSPHVGTTSSRASLHAYLRESVYRSADNARANVGFGSDATGSMRLETRSILNDILITSTTIRSSMGMFDGLLIGRLRASIVVFDKGCTLWIGRLTMRFGGCRWSSGFEVTRRDRGGMRFAFGGMRFAFPPYSAFPPYGASLSAGCASLSRPTGGGCLGVRW